MPKTIVLLVVAANAKPDSYCCIESYMISDKENKQQERTIDIIIVRNNMVNGLSLQEIINALVKRNVIVRIDKLIPGLEQYAIPGARKRQYEP